MNYRVRISELEQTVVELKATAKACAVHLETLHRSIFTLERDLAVIQA